MFNPLVPSVFLHRNIFLKLYLRKKREKRCFSTAFPSLFRGTITYKIYEDVIKTQCNALKKILLQHSKMSLIGDRYLTPSEKAEHIAWWDTVQKDEKGDTEEEKETKAYTRWVMMLLVNGNFQYCKGYEDVLRPSREDWKRATAKKQHGQFVTISLPNTHKIEPDKFYDKCVNCKSFVKFIFTAEFFSGVESNLNKHYHIFIYGKVHKANTIKFFSRFFKISKNFVDVVQTYDEETNKQKIKYIKGEKKDDKLINVVMDRRHRAEKGLKDYYTYNI